MLAALSSGCSVERFATNRIADTLAASGSTYAGDDDPELVGAALPFSLKLMESVLAETPEHRELLAATAAAFTQYAYAFVQQQGDRLALEDTDRAWESWNRARKLYLRARDYGLRGLDVAHPGFSAGLDADHAATVQQAGPADVELLYWTAVSWAGAIALGKDDPALVADLAIVSALIDRSLALDEGWDRGAIHSFLISYSMARPDVAGRSRRQRARALRSRRRFERGKGCRTACVLGGGGLPAPGGPRLLRSFDRGGAQSRRGRGSADPARQYRDEATRIVACRPSRRMDSPAARRVGG